MIVQQYISKPLLMDGYKFDLRVYVLVSSCDPLRIYVFNEGLVRLATVDYVDPTNANTEDVCMHLTNYAINKHSDNFVRPTGADAEDNSDASKRSFAFFNDWLDDTNRSHLEDYHLNAEVSFKKLNIRYFEIKSSRANPTLITILSQLECIVQKFKIDFAFEVLP